MRIHVPVLLLLGLLAACSPEPEPAPQGATTSTIATAQPPRATTGTVEPIPAIRPARAARSFAGLSDRGDLVAYDRARKARKAGAYTWHPVHVSEEHALHAIGSGRDLVITGPDGQPIQLQYDHHIEHENGNWTWVGRPPGAQPGTEAIITFGDKAAFGTIPYGDQAPLRLNIASGQAWLIETDNAVLEKLDRADARSWVPDFVLPPPSSRKAAGSEAIQPTGPFTQAAQTHMADVSLAADSTVDVLIGYTSGFATRLGGQSQANTRLTFLVDVTNQAYANSQLPGRVRLVHTVQVAYPDATDNSDALDDLASSSPPASLQPLLSAQVQYGIDLISLVRKFNDPENDSCGIAYLLGGGQQPVDPSDRSYGRSVVSDSSGNLYPDGGFICSDETLAHELGHNMGSAHDVEESKGEDGLLDPNDYGRYPYSFGYKSAAGNFYTVMAYGENRQTRYRVFSNPRITYCGGNVCGITDQADNARSLSQMMPVIAAFRASVSAPAPTLPLVPASGDFDGDGKFDLLWRSSSNGANVLWKGASIAQTLASVTDQNWKVVGIGDFGGDGKSDIVWRHSTTGANVLWHSGTSGQSLATIASQTWNIVGVGDFDGDGRSDLLWRNSSSGANALWKSGTVGQSLTTVTDPNWRVVAVGDFDGDGRSDILWRNGLTGANEIWKAANSASKLTLATLASQSWQIIGTGDFDADHKSDILWRNGSSGANTLWKGGTVGQSLTTLADLNWKVAGLGDYNGDGRSDIMWRNSATGANQIWNSGNSATPRSLATVSSTWKVAP